MIARDAIDTCQTWQELAAFVAPRSLESWLTSDERNRLLAYARALHDGDRSLEIGVNDGRTLKLFAMAVADGVDVIGIDSWTNETLVYDFRTGERCDLRTSCVSNLEVDGLLDRVTLLDGPSQTWGETWKLPLAFLLIDGDHTYQGASADLRLFAPHVTVGGIMCVDDVDTIKEVRTAFDDWLQGAKGWTVFHRYSDVREGKMAILRREELWP